MIELVQIHQTLSKHGYEYEKFLGKGSFSSVILCTSKKYNQYFAIKRVVKNEATQFKFSTMLSLNHPNIVKLYDTFEDDLAQYLVMEYCSNGTLKQQGKISDEKFILYAISYCHSRNVAHRDIKPENIFLDQYYQIKLGDFGLAKKFDSDSKTKDKCGSLMFFSPEMIQSKSICPFKADIWASGITFFFMTTGTYPYPSASKEELKKLIFFGQLDFDDYNINQDIRHLISKMAVKNVNLRLSSDELLKLPIFPQRNICKAHHRKSFVIKSNENTDMIPNCRHEKENTKQKMIKMNSFRIINNPSNNQRNNNRIHHLTF